MLWVSSRNETEDEMTKQEQVAKRSDVFWVLVSEILVDDQENYTRAKRGDIEGLALSIMSEGIRTPLRCYKQEGAYYLTGGYRRMAAVELINSNPDRFGMPIDRVPVLMEPRYSNDADRSLWQMLDNSHRVDASPMEEAKAMQKLMEVHGLDEQEIAKRMGKPKKWVADRLGLLKVAQPIRKAVEKGDVAPTVALDIARRHEGDEKGQQEALEKAKASAGLRGRRKPTVRDARKAMAPSKPRQKTRSVVEIKETITEIGHKMIKADNQGKKYLAEDLSDMVGVLEWVLGGKNKPWEK